MLFQFGAPRRRGSKSRFRTVFAGLERLEDRQLLTTIAGEFDLVAEVAPIDMPLDVAMFSQSASVPESPATKARLAARRGDQDSAYYVAPHGSDQNSGDDIGRPFQTIGAALRHVQPGDTVFVMPGVYREEVANPPGGTEPHPVRLVAYDPDRRPILRPNPGANRVFFFASMESSYIEIDGFVMDAVNVNYDVVKITGTTKAGGSHHISIRNSELKNGPSNGILITGDEYQVSRNQLTGLVIHDKGIDSNMSANQIGPLEGPATGRRDLLASAR